MKTIKITVEVDGSGVTRSYTLDDNEERSWGYSINDMLDTLEKANDPKF